MEKDAKTTKENTKKHKKTGLIIGIVAIVVVLFLAIGGYFYHIARPQAIFEKNIKKEVNNIVTYLTPLNENNTSKGKVTLSSEFKIDDDDEDTEKILRLLNGFTYDVAYQIDFKNKLFDLNLDTKFEKEDTFNLNLYAEDETENILLKGVYDKYITSENNDFEDLYHIGDKNIDYEVILNGFKEALLDAIDDLEFEKKKETLKIDGVNYKTTKNYFELDDEDYIDFYVEIIDNLLDDKEFMKAYKAYEGSHAREELEALRNEIKDTEYEGNKFSAAFYTIGAKKEVKKIVIDKTLYDALTIVEFTNLGDNKTKFEYTTNQGVFTATLNNGVKVDGNKMKGKLEIKFNVEDYISGTIKLDIDSTFGGKFKKVDVSNNILDEKLTKKDEKKIDKNIKKNKGLVKFLELIEMIEAPVEY